MPTPARVLALRTLGELERGGVTLAELLARPEIDTLPARERSFLHELVLGTLRRRGELDHALAPLLDRPLARLDPSILQVLRLGAYQILKLRVKDRAAVAESVELARTVQPRATGFVNAVLRRLAREGAPAPPDPDLEPRAWLTSAGSLPRWLADRWVEQLGAPAAVARARAFLEAPPVTLRLNPRAPDPEARFLAEGLRLEPGLVPGAWRLVAGRAATLQGEGVVYVQDEGSQLVARLAAGPGRRLDACAAPGGKALLMGDLSEGEGTVVAADVSPRRLALMKAAALRWRSGNVLLLAADGRRPPFRARFAAVLLDAPCSGLGTIARHPDIRWRARAEDLPGHARRQRALLDSLAPLVEPGGRLVYSVCSAEPEETEQVVGLFLAANPGFRAEPLPEWAAPFAAGAFLRTSPERHGGDAFFAALLGRA